MPKEHEHYQVPHAPPTRPTWAGKNREAEVSGWPFPDCLTRLSVHGEGHRDQEAERHRGGAARQPKLCGARQGPALHLAGR